MRKVLYLFFLGMLLMSINAMAQVSPSLQQGCTYVWLSGGGVDAFPNALVSDIQTIGNTIRITDTRGAVYTYQTSEASLNTTLPGMLPSFTRFRFDHSDNDMLMVDAEGTFIGDTAIHIAAGGIGKRLIARWETDLPDAIVLAQNTVQINRKSSMRYETAVSYTVTLPGYRMLTQQTNGTLLMLPFGHDYVVRVNYLSDHPTTTYGVPEIRIVTSSGQSITSRDYYLDATIAIDGAGYYPDMPAQNVQVKGRGNSSWNFQKKPYRLKFATKQRPLGMKSGRSWNLIAAAQTGSMTTNMIGSRAAELVGADGANHFIPVELYINGEYRGSYSLTEKIGLSNNSIDLKSDSNAVLLELDSYSSDFTTTAKFDGQRLPVTVKDPDLADTAEVTNLTLSNIQSHFNGFISALAAGQDLTNWLDYASTARYLMVNELVLNYELMHPKSMFCYNENILADSLYHFGPVWDLDWGFGLEHSGTYFASGDSTDNYYESKSGNLERKSFPYKLRYCGEEMNKEYYRVWTDFVANKLPILLEYMQDYYDVAARSLAHDNTKWYTGANYAQITARSIAWVRNRSTYVLRYLSETLGYADKGYLDPEPTGIPASPSSSTLGAEMFVRDGVIYFRTAGGDVLYDILGHHVQ